MNITVRVASAKALAQLKAVQGQVNATNSSLTKAAVGANTFNRGLALSPLVKYGNQIQWVGRQLQYNFTLPILLAGGAAAKFALDNEKAFTRIRKVYGDLSMDARVLNNELDALSGAFVALSNHYGVQQKEVLNIAADWAAAGASGVALAKGVEQTLVTMVLGEMNAAEATKALISIQAQYRQGTQELADTIGILNIVENQTGASLPDLITGLSRAAGSARNAGVDVRHLAAYMAALVPAAGSAASAGNALKTILSRLMAPTLDATSLLKEMGIETAAMSWKSLTAVDRVKLLAEAFDKLPQAQKAAVSATLGSRYQLNRFDILLESVIKRHSYYNKALDATSNRVLYMRQAQRELNTVLESNPQRLKQIWVILQNAMADVVQPLIPIILMAASALKDFFTAFTNLPPEIQKVITIGLLFLAVLGPLIRYIGATTALIGILGNAVHGLGRMMFFLAGAVKTLIKLPLQAFWAVLSTAAGALWGFVGGAVASLASLATAGATAAAAPLVAFVKWMKIIALGGLRFVLMNMLFAITEFVAATAALTLTQGFKPVLMALLAPFVSAAALLPAALVHIHAVVYIGLVRLAAIMRTAMAGIMAVWTLLPGAIALVMREVWAVLMMSGGVSAVIVRSWTALTVALAFTFERMAVALTGIWAATQAALVAITVGMRTIMLRAWVWLEVSLVATWTATMAAIRGAWAATLLFLSSGTLIRATLTRIATLIASYAAFIAAGISWPIVAAVTAGLALIIGLSYAFRDEIAHVWNEIVQGATDSFNSLPAGIAAAMSAVVTIVYKAAMAVYELFSYLNPFATHSPSLVQNVTNGMAEIRKQFATVTQISGPIEKAYADIKKFSQATADLRKGLDSAARAKDLKNLRLVAPGAIDEFKTLVKDLQRLQKIEADLANNPGMKAMEEQINKNDIAQKKLRLEMLKMGDAGDIDKIKSKYADLQGQIEMLSGQRSSLRSAGAGSDITAWYDDQIKALEGQQGALQAQAGPIQALNDQLAELQRQGEILNLEDSLQFDPIRKQADDVATAIRDIQSALNDMTSAADQVARAREAAKGGKGAVGPGTQAFLDAAGGDFPIPGGKGKDIGREFPNIKDQSGLINQFTQDLAKQTAGMFDKFDVFGPLKKKWGEFTAWIDGTVKPKIDETKKWIADLFGGMGNTGPIAGTVKFFEDAWNAIKDWGKALWRLFGEDLIEMWDAIKEAGGQIFEELGPEIEKFKKLWKPLKRAFDIWGPVLLILAQIIGVVLLGALKLVTNILAEVLGPILETVINVIGDVIQVIRGFFQIILGLLTGNQQLFLDGVANIFSGLGQLLWHIFTGAKDIVLGLVWGIVEGIWDFFTWLSDELVGHSIIPDMIDAIIDYFKGLPGRIWNALKNLGSKIKNRAIEGMVAFRDGVVNRWESIRSWFAERPGKIRDALGNLITVLVQRGRDTIRGFGDGVREKWEDFKLWLQGFGTRIYNALPNPLKMLYNAGRQIVQGLIDGIRDKLSDMGKAGSMLAKQIGINLPGSPVQAGPLKVLNRGYAGGQIVKMLADGITAQLPLLSSAAQAAATATNAGLSNVHASIPTLRTQAQLAASAAPVVTTATGRVNAASTRAQDTVTQSNGGERHLHFHGNLEFPNITNGDDAKKFIENLESMAG